MKAIRPPCDLPPVGEFAALVKLGATDAEIAHCYGKTYASWSYKVRKYYGIPAFPKNRRTDNPERKGFGRVDTGAVSFHEPTCRVPTDEQTAAWHKGYRFDRGRVG